MAKLHDCMKTPADFRAQTHLDEMWDNVKTAGQHQNQW